MSVQVIKGCVDFDSLLVSRFLLFGEEIVLFLREFDHSWCFHGVLYDVPELCATTENVTFPICVRRRTTCLCSVFPHREILITSCLILLQIGLQLEGK